MPRPTGPDCKSRLNQVQNGPWLHLLPEIPKIRGQARNQGHAAQEMDMAIRCSMHAQG